MGSGGCPFGRSAAADGRRGFGQMDNRRSKRLETEETVNASVGSFDMELLVVDLSAEGCRVEVTGTAMGAGSAITLFFEAGVAAKGTVVWRRGFHAGIRFRQRLKTALIDQLAGAPVLIEVHRASPLAA